MTTPRARLGRVLRASLLAAVALGGCRSAPHAPPPPTPPTSPPPVRRASEEVVVAAWAEPARLPAAGGQVQILVRAQKRDGRPFPGVEVRLQTSTGTLYSGGRVLLTDARGMTRDRLTTRRAATIVLNAGGTRYKFRVPMSVANER